MEIPHRLKTGEGYVRAPASPGGSLVRYLPALRPLEEDAALGIVPVRGLGEARLQREVEGGAQLPARAGAPGLAAPGERHARVGRQESSRGVESVARLGVEARLGIERSRGESPKLCAHIRSAPPAAAPHAEPTRTERPRPPSPGA